MDRKQHWEQVYTNKPSDAVSWFQNHADQSLRLIHNTGLGKDAAIIDVGGGASTLVDDLLVLLCHKYNLGLIQLQCGQWPKVVASAMLKRRRSVVIESGT